MGIAVLTTGLAFLLGVSMGMLAAALVCVIAVLESTRVFRLTRAVAMNSVMMDYVKANYVVVARVPGEGPGRVIERKVLFNALPPLVALLTVVVTLIVDRVLHKAGGVKGWGLGDTRRSLSQGFLAETEGPAHSAEHEDKWSTSNSFELGSSLFSLTALKFACIFII